MSPRLAVRRRRRLKVSSHSFFDRVFAATWQVSISAVNCELGASLSASKRKTGFYARVRRGGMRRDAGEKGVRC